MFVVLKLDTIQISRVLSLIENKIEELEDSRDTLLKNMNKGEHIPTLPFVNQELEEYRKIAVELGAE